jgi:hypothetical protein
MSLSGVNPSGGALTWTAFAPVVLPFGTKVTQVTAQLLRQSTGDISKVEFYRISNGGSPTLIATLNSTHTTGWKTLNSSALSVDVTTARTFVIFVSLKNASAGFLYADWSYTIGNYSTQAY